MGHATHEDIIGSLDEPMMYFTDRSGETRASGIEAKGDGFVYFVSSAGLVKIGITDNLRRRLMGLNAQSAVPVTLIASITTTYERAKAIERQLHDRFAQARQHGEWFKINASAIAATVREFEGSFVAAPAVREKIALSVAAKMCGVDYDTFLRWVVKGVIPHVVVGPHNRKRVYRDDVDKLNRDVK